MVRVKLAEPFRQDFLLQIEDGGHQFTPLQPNGENVGSRGIQFQEDGSAPSAGDPVPDLLDHAGAQKLRDNDGHGGGVQSRLPGNFIAGYGSPPADHVPDQQAVGHF